MSPTNNSVSINLKRVAENNSMSAPVKFMDKGGQGGSVSRLLIFYFIFGHKIYPVARFFSGSVSNRKQTINFPRPNDCLYS